MPVLDSDLEYHASMNHHPRAPAYRTTTHPNNTLDTSNTSPTGPPLPTSTYSTPSRKKRPSVSSVSDQTTTPSTLHGPGPSPLEDEDSDPRDFYRSHQDPFGTGLIVAGLGQGDIRVEKRGEKSPYYNDHSLPLSHRSNSPRLPPMASRLNNSRYVSSSAGVDRSPLHAPKSSPTLSNTAQKRQTSVRELANKFNEVSDEAPPVPKKSLSRSTSTSSNAASQTSKSRTSSRSKKADETNLKMAFTPGEMSLMKTPKSPRTHPRRGKPVEGERGSSPRGKSQHKFQNGVQNHMQPLASQSMVDLAPEAISIARKPLFGEVLNTESKPVAGYKIPPARRRRGSEGNMHNPNPMFTDTSQMHAEQEELSPTAQPGVTSQNGTLSPPYDYYRTLDSHRRTLSANAGPPPKLANIHFSDLSSPSSPTSTENSRRESYSRIPVSTHRLSAVSDSGNSSQLSRTNSDNAMAGNPSQTMTSPHRVRAPPPKPLQNAPAKPSRRVETPSEARRMATSPTLNAYISAPMPKKSPPLRSSRPRQPVSSASTSASRARAVEKHSLQDAGYKPESRTRRPPELEGIDIAARREAIQRSYTKKVGERERKVEAANKRKASMLKQEEERAGGMDPARLEKSSNLQDGKGDVLPESNMDSQTANLATQEEDAAQAEQDLTINTGHLAERSVLDLSMEDSPTLGTFGKFSAQQHAVGKAPSQSDQEPLSAITAGTSDSMDTFFDDEPQDDSTRNSQQPSQNHMDLSQIIDMELSGAMSPTAIRKTITNEQGSEKDDRESIQIMLGDTPVLEKAPFVTNHFGRYEDNSPSQEGPHSRWSMTSRDSSGKSRDEQGESPESSLRQTPRSSQPTHLSISTSASERTQPVWSPASFASLKTSRTTMDSDSYSTINRVLDHYHDPNSISPQDVQQHLIQSPVLARQGGWDPKKVTQLYMQQFMDRHPQLNTPPPPPDFQGASQDAARSHQRKEVSHTPPTSTSAEKEVRDDMDGKIVHKMERQHHDEIVSSSQNLQPDESDVKPARASLSRPEDWTMSPSLGEYTQQANAVDSPATDEKPMLPPKDYKSKKRSMDEIVDPKGDRHRPITPGARPQLPEITRHDPLDIVVEPPRSSDSASAQPPPLPQSSPPLPPSLPNLSQSQPSQQARPASPPSPADFSRNASSESYPTKESFTDVRTSSASLTDGQRPPLGLPLSLQPSHSSAISQDPPVIESLSGTTAVASKSSSPSPDQKRLTRRNHIIKELVDTEHSFCQDMKVVDDIYKGTSSVIISPEDVKTLFGNSDQILVFSTNFLDALKQASKSVYILAKSKRWRSNRVSSNTTYSGTTDDQSSIGGPELSDDEKDRKTFIGEAYGHHMVEMEKVYAEYLKNHDSANQKLQALQKNPKVQIWLKECRAYAHDLTAAWDLDSLLVKPVQRILKYPLLLDQLLEVTPENHPDYTALDIAAREMKGISMRINEMKKRADLLEQVSNSNRKRKESDVRIGFPKAFGRRTEKLKQQVGLSDMVEDKAYAAVREKFGTHFFQIQVVMRDVEMYTNDVQVFMNRFCDFTLAIEAHIDVSQTSYPEIESKWRKFRMSMRDLSTTALTDHMSAVRKHVIEPLITLYGLHSYPQKLIDKRSKRLMDYARYKAIKDRGDKPDKKAVENAELFMAVNDSLKDELPKLFEKTAKLVEACLNNFIQLQVQWQKIWRKKLSHALDDAEPSRSIRDIVESFTSDFAFFEAQVVSLSICNGSMINETPNLLSATTTLNGDDGISSRHTTSMDSQSRTLSVSSDRSPQLPQPDFGGRSSGSFFSVGDTPQLGTGLHREPSRRMRASSTLSVNSPRTPEVPGAYRTYSNSTTPVNATPTRATAAPLRNNTEPSPSLGPTQDTPRLNRYSDDSALTSNRTSGSTYPSTSYSRPDGESGRFSGVFSSAMPMSDSPPSQSPVSTPGQRPEYNVIFLAASVYEFNIDRARREAGYPYLTYVAGEIFDVIGEKGELWLAKNQDDATNLVGWIWNKHFVKLAS